MENVMSKHGKRAIIVQQTHSSITEGGMGSSTPHPPSRSDGLLPLVLGSIKLKPMTT